MTPEAGKLVASLREQRGMTQKDLADAVGVDPATISRGERGLGPWYIKTARRIYDTLNTHAPLQEGEALALLRGLGLSTTLLKRPPAGAEPNRFSILPQDIEAIVSQMIYVVGPIRVLEFMQAAVNLMAASDDVQLHAAPSLPPAPTGALAREFEDPETGLRGKMYTPASPPAAKPATPRRKKSG